MFSKQYKVVKSVERANGKWSQSLGNSFFIDSEWLLPDFVQMLEDHLRMLFERRGIEDSHHLQTY